MTIKMSVETFYVLNPDTPDDYPCTLYLVSPAPLGGNRSKTWMLLASNTKGNLDALVLYDGTEADMKAAYKAEVNRWVTDGYEHTVARLENALVGHIGDVMVIGANTMRLWCLHDPTPANGESPEELWIRAEETRAGKKEAWDDEE